MAMLGGQMVTPAGPLQAKFTTGPCDSRAVWLVSHPQVWISMLETVGILDD